MIELRAASKPRHKLNSHYYTEGTRQIVAGRYAGNIEYFDYLL